MPGLNDNTLVHGVLDLIDARLKKTINVNQSDDDGWEGTPSVILSREHPLDEWVLTSALLIYPSGNQVNVILNRGMTDEEIAKAIAKNNEDAYVPPIDLEAPIDEDVLPEYNLLSLEEQNPDYPVYNLETGSFGTYSIEPTIPVEVDGPDHYDYEYYKEWRLRNVVIEKFDSNRQPIERLILHMVYDLQSKLVAVMAEVDMEWLN